MSVFCVLRISYAQQQYHIALSTANIKQIPIVSAGHIGKEYPQKLLPRRPGRD